jgi:hypothetical protein
MRALVMVSAAVALLQLWQRPGAPPVEDAGKVERFHQGRQEWTVRRIAEPSRQVHPAEECYRATGWQVRPLPMRMNDSLRWGCFEATRKAERVEVCQTIVDGAGRSWSDPGSWWWSTLWRPGGGPWKGVVMVTR